LNAITEIFTLVDQKVLLSIFESWVNRPKWAVNHNRKYYTKSRKNKKHFFTIGKKTGGYEPMDRLILPKRVLLGVDCFERPPPIVFFHVVSC
jgi:hypothetical protein